MSQENIPFPNYISMFYCVLIVFAAFIWRRRKLYYLSYKLKGPFAFPFLGSLYLFKGGHREMYDICKYLLSTYSPLYRIWMGPYLLVVDSRPEDVEILNICLEKPRQYHNFGYEVAGSGLVTSPKHIWKRHRKIINPCFNTKILSNYHETFVKHSKNLITVLNDHCGNGKIDLWPEFFKCTLNISCESLTDVDSSAVAGQEEYITRITTFEEVILQRFCNLFLHCPLFWRISSLRKKMLSVTGQMFDFLNQIIDVKKKTLSSFNDNDSLKNKHFLNHLLDQKDHLTEQEILEEAQTIMIASSETTTITLNFVIMAVAIHPHVQEKIFEELDSVFGNSDRDPTVEDLSKIEYLERVIKETLRLLPPAPMIARDVTSDVKLSDGIVLPAGSKFMVPIVQLHRNPEVWPNPLKFDPDRFLPEEVEKRHKCSYIPFSYGVRNCIGFRYAMMSIKVILVTFFRKYKVVSVGYNSVEEIELDFILLVKPSNGCRATLEKRTL